jgi:hypothetical protein
MKRVSFLFFTAILLHPHTFSQNMLSISAEANLFFPPAFWHTGAGFNLSLFNNYIQNEAVLYFGSISAPKNLNGNDTAPVFFLSLNDKLFFALDGKYLGLRTGLSVTIGLFPVEDTPNLLLNPGAFVGFSLFPRSLFSLTFDITPAYALRLFQENNDTSISHNGFNLAFALAVRLNFEKL